MITLTHSLTHSHVHCRELSTQERKKREALLATYGFDTEAVGEDGQIFVTTEKPTTGDLPGMMVQLLHSHYGVTHLRAVFN
jgi:hypothetical protein